MEDPDDVALGSGYPAAAGQAVDARGMLQAATDLVNPVTAAREMPRLAGELLKIALGRSDLAFDEKDARFQDVTWRDHPLFRRLAHELPADQPARAQARVRDRRPVRAPRRAEHVPRPRPGGMPSMVTGSRSRSARGSPAHRALSCTGRRSSSCFSARQAR